MTWPIAELVTGSGLLLGIISAALAMAWAMIRKGRKEAENNARLDALEREKALETTRKRIDADVQADTDLAARARRSGLQRPDDR